MHVVGRVVLLCVYTVVLQTSTSDKLKQREKRFGIQQSGGTQSGTQSGTQVGYIEYWLFSCNCLSDSAYCTANALKLSICVTHTVTHPSIHLSV